MTNAALLFPGQGAHDWKILDGLKATRPFKAIYPLLCDLLGFSPVDGHGVSDESLINQNRISSTLTVFASVVSLELYREQGGIAPPKFSAGYSVGQWTALYSAGCVTLEDLLRTVIDRSALMDDCFVERQGAMVGIIGVKVDEVELFCQQQRAQGRDLFVSNYNSVGQVSIAGTSEAIDIALAQIEQLNPMKVQRLPVSGGWHCPLLETAAERFAETLQNLTFTPPKTRIINNVTGNFFEWDQVALRRDLCMHLVLPVQWERGIRTLIDQGCTSFIEIGYGNQLTKFGKFINRTLPQHAFYNGSEEV